MRHAFVMTLKPGNEALYKKRHDEIWPEMTELMKKGPLRTFSIYRHGLTLFAYQEFDDGAAPGGPIDPIVWKWWRSMEPLMETNPDSSPVAIPLEEMFHFERTGA